MELIKREALANGAADAVVANHWSEGGTGAVAVADALVRVTSTPSPNQFRFLYDLNLSIEDKISKIAREMYGAASVELSQNVKDKLKTYYQLVIDL